MKRLHLALTALSLTLATSAGAAPAEVEDSVVRVFASLRPPNPMRPWAKQNAVEVMGTGVVLDGKTILTNAHIVLYAGEIFVQDRQGGDRFNAKVATIGPEIDLATLTLEDDSFFEQAPADPPRYEAAGGQRGGRRHGVPGRRQRDGDHAGRRLAGRLRAL